MAKLKRKAKLAATPTQPVRPKPAKKLTGRQTAFVAEYLVDRNATQAAIRAGYSPRNADVTGPYLLGNVGVAAAIARGQEALAKRTGRTVEAVLDRLEHLSRAAEDAGDFGPALRGAELVGKHLGMFAQRLEVSGPEGGPIEVANVRQRLTERLGTLARRLDGGPVAGGEAGPEPATDGGVPGGDA